MADECRTMHERALQQIEQKINAGIEKLLSACTSHVKSLLSEKKAPEYAFTGDEKESMGILNMNGTEVRFHTAFFRNTLPLGLPSSVQLSEQSA